MTEFFLGSSVIVVGQPNVEKMKTIMNKWALRGGLAYMVTVRTSEW